MSAGFGWRRAADEFLLVTVPPPAVVALGVGEVSRWRDFEEAEALTLTEIPSCLACCLINLLGF
jgi:hypothetical protein